MAIRNQGLPLLTSERTLIRIAEPRDAERLLEYFRSSGRRYDPPLPDELLTLEYWRSQSEAMLAEAGQGTALRLFVFDRSEAHILGTVALTRITRGVRQDCSLGYAVRAESEGKGIMLEATSAVINYAFDVLSLHRIEACHTPDNQRSRMLLQRLGFERVGTIPGFMLTEGTRRDSVLNSLLNPNWRTPQK